MIAAVEAALASAQLAAATLTVRHGPAAGRPVRGSTMWCITGRPAATGGRSPTTWPTAAAGEPDRAAPAPARPGAGRVVGDQHRPAARRRLPRHRDVAAQADQHAAAAAARPVRPRRLGPPVSAQALGGRAQVKQHARGHGQQRPSSRTARQPGAGPGRAAARPGSARSRRNRGRSRARSARRRRSGRPGPRSSAAAASATPTASASPSLIRNRPPPAGAARRSPSRAGTGSPAGPARQLVVDRGQAEAGFSGGQTASRAVVPSASRSGGRGVTGSTGATRLQPVPRRVPQSWSSLISCPVGRRCRTWVTTVLPFTGAWSAPVRPTRWSSRPSAPTCGPLAPCAVAVAAAPVGRRRPSFRRRGRAGSLVGQARWRRRPGDQRGRGPVRHPPGVPDAVPPIRRGLAAGSPVVPGRVPESRQRHPPAAVSRSNPCPRCPSIDHAGFSPAPPSVPARDETDRERTM